MKIRIDKYGKLDIERAGQLKPQECPHGHSEDIFCGDWCPLFGEPEPFSFDPITGEPIDETIELDLCSKTLSINVEDFEDER